MADVAGGVAGGAASGAGIGTAILPGWGTAIGALIGGIAGGFSASDSETKKTGPDSPSTLAAQGMVDKSLQQQYDMTQAGPGQEDVTNAYNSTKSLADLFQQYSQTGGLPTQQQTDYSWGVSKNLYAGQQQALNNSFIGQRTQAQQTAAALGRSPDDPVFAAKLAAAQTQQQSVLSGNQQATAQQLALSLPGQQLAYAQQGNSLLQGLASQAFSNRASILAQGNQIVGIGNGMAIANTTTTNSTGGGVGGAINGVIGGAAAGNKIYSAYQNANSVPDVAPQSNWAGQGTNGWSVTGVSNFA